MNSLLQLDRNLFQAINAGHWHNDYIDTFMLFVRNRDTWWPFYLFLFVFAIINLKKKAFWWIVFGALTVVISNFISSDLIKEHVFRLRPCNDPTLADSIRILVSYRPQSSSFTSSHATNHFAMGSFFYFTLSRLIGKWALLFILWASLICFAQVYVGVHYPLDVICGGLIGFIFGYLVAKLYSKIFSLS
ncbi:MAG: phosphatase PAP2 family protein [Bacteroidetes bacterium]|nr:phosphatase PAP2 family protein [Bacteroidota bacterium]